MSSNERIWRRLDVLSTERKINLLVKPIIYVEIGRVTTAYRSMKQLSKIIRKSWSVKKSGRVERTYRHIYEELLDYRESSEQNCAHAVSFTITNLLT